MPASRITRRRPSPAPAGLQPAKARATIADVAKAAQVSKATVSRYLNGRTDILTPDMAERVRVNAFHYQELAERYRTAG